MEVPARDRHLFSISDAEVEELARYAVLIEKHYARPMDIEWARDGEDGKLYILQARPETVKSREGADNLRRYPDPTSLALRSSVARYYGLRPEQVFVGNGSDEVLAHVFYGLLRHDKPVLFPDISYSFYPVYCGLYGVTHSAVPLTSAFQIRIDDYFIDNGGIIFPNPNAPTGSALALSEIERLLTHNRESVVVIDEAYVDFGAESAVTLIDRFPQLLITQTVSKSRALAGLRVGLALGHTELIEGLTRVKDSFNSYPLDRLASAGAVAAFDDEAHFERTRRAVIGSRDLLGRELGALGFEVLPSQANFVFARHPSFRGPELTAALRERAVLVRNFRAPRIEDFLRITVGLPEENAALIDALRQILASR
jgi:histidinol-phosphate aminotransferase